MPRTLGSTQGKLSQVRMAGCRAPLWALHLQIRKMGSPSKCQPVHHQGASSGDLHKKCQKYCSLPGEKLRTLTLSKWVAFHLYCFYPPPPNTCTPNTHTSSSLQVCATILPKYKLRAIKLKAIGTVSLKNKKCKPCQKGFAKSVALNIQNMSLVRGGGESKAKVQTWGLMYLV